MAHGRYHKLLRVSAVLTAVVMIFDGGFIAPVTKELSNNTWNYLAQSIGVFAGVPENEINVITKELTEREQALNEREANLAEREIDARDYGTGNRDISLYVLSAILFILTVLILLNYAMDWLRVKHLYNNAGKAT